VSSSGGQRRGVAGNRAGAMASRSKGGGGEGILSKTVTWVAVAGERAGGSGWCGSGPLTRKRFLEF
jgi:hypothetical protein